MKKDILSLVRPNILKMEPYSTARDEFSGSGIGIFLDANESPYCNGLNRYPDPRQKALKERVSKIKDMPEENIFIGNGSDEAIDLLFRVFCSPGRDNAIAISPSYGMYGVAAYANDVEIKQVSLESDFSLNTEKLLSAADSSTKLLFLCSPNNPSGNSFPTSQIMEIVERFDGIVVVDEAYIDFSSQASLLPRIKDMPSLVVLQTFSKAWGMAGLRIGIAFASSLIISLLSKIKYPYNINILAQRTGLQRLNEAETKRHVESIKKERERVAEGLEKCACVLKVYPSDANFLLVKVNDADYIYKKLTEGGIIVRNRNKTKGCEGCLRITIGTPEENGNLLEIMSSPEAGPKPVFCGAEGQRFAVIKRKTAETNITIELDLDRQAGPPSISTGLGFFDHMLLQLPHHGAFHMSVKAEGDLNVDEHHTIEDVGICIGEALAKALGTKRGIERYGFVLPMDDSEAMVLLDLGGRIDFQWDVDFRREKIGDMPTEMFKHFFFSLCCGAKCNLHISAKGENEHHKAEAVFKALARAIRMAVNQSPFPYETASTKGIL